MLIYFLCASTEPIGALKETPSSQCTRLMKELLFTKDYSSTDKIRVNALSTVLKQELDNSSDGGKTIASVLQAADDIFKLVKYLDQYKEKNPEVSELLLTLQILQVVQATKYAVKEVSGKVGKEGGCTCDIQ